MKKINIIDLILRRLEYGFVSREVDPWLLDVAKGNSDEQFVIVSEGSLNIRPIWNREIMEEILAKYNINGIFDLNSPFAMSSLTSRENRTAVKCTLLWLSKEKPKKIVIGNVVSNKLTEKRYSDNVYFEYYDAIEKWFETGKMPGESDLYEFNEVPSEYVPLESLYPKMHSKTAYRVREFLSKEDSVSLFELADVTRPKLLSREEKTTKVITPNMFEYPLKQEKLSYSFPNDVILKKGDIVASMFGKFYLINEELEEEIHPSANSVVIRPKAIDPYYLYLYLTSETAETILNSVSRGTFGHIPPSELRNLRVIKPKETPEKYKKTFLEQVYSVSDLKELGDAYSQITMEAETIEDIINIEYAHKIKTYKKSIMQEFLEQDLEEINRCFNAKAYKATIIMAGSVLEAILIDWMSEKDGKNYFDEPMTVYRNGRWKTATLYDYIDEIKEIERPSWEKGAERAHIIREKRNMVHARVCIYNPDEINESACKEVVNYLIYVIESRGLRRKSMQNKKTM